MVASDLVQGMTNVAIVLGARYTVKDDIPFRLCEPNSRLWPGSEVRGQRR